MTVYHYKSSLLDRVEVHSPYPGQVHATIIAAAGTDAGSIAKIREALGAKSISTLMDTVDGKPVIQVRGIKNEKDLLATLDALGFAQGGVEKETTPEHHKQPNFRERVRGKALFLSAIFYNIGNVAFFVSGIQRGRHNLDSKMRPNDKSEFMIGSAFAAGDILMMAYGKDKGDEELNAAAQGLKRHLHQKGIEVPQGNALNPDALHEKGVAKASDRWLRKHIVHVKCLTELAGGLFTMHAALKPGEHNRSKLTAGFLITAAWLATFLLEKPRGHSIFTGDDPSSLAEKMKQNPRGWVARPLAMGNNLFNLHGAYHERAGVRTEIANIKNALTKPATNELIARNVLAHNQGKQHDYLWNVISACSFLVAHTLFGISGSKQPKETEDDKTMMNDLVLLSANVLARQPEPVRWGAIAETAEYLSHLAPVHGRKEEVERAIHDKVESLTKSSWAARIQTPVQAEQPSVTL